MLVYFLPNIKQIIFKDFLCSMRSKVEGLAINNNYNLLFVKMNFSLLVMYVMADPIHLNTS